MTDKCLEEFEAKFPMPTNCIRCGLGYASTSYSAFAAIEYAAMWKAWQASRAALVVELPVVTHYQAVDAMRGIKRSLDEAGVTYK